MSEKDNLQKPAEGENENKKVPQVEEDKDIASAKEEETKTPESGSHADAIVEEHEAREAINNQKEEGEISTKEAVESGTEQEGNESEPASLDEKKDAAPVKDDSPAEEIDKTGQPQPESKDQNKDTAQDETDDAEAEEEDEDDDEDGEEKVPTKDYTDLDRSALIKELRKLIQDFPIQKIKEQVEEIRKEFVAQDKENEEALRKKFQEENPDNGDPAAPKFEYRDELKNEFEDLHKLYRQNRGKYQREKREQLEKNLAERKNIIQEIKNLIEEEENIGTTFKKFHELQDRWNAAGKIPHDAYNTTWNDYRFHVENFYDYIDVSKELRDKDFERNLKMQNKIIARAEELVEENNVHKALRELQELHRMWKEDVGPVARELRDDTWNRFSTATKKIHDKRQEYYAEQDKKREENQTIKQNINKEIKRLADEGAKNHRGWQDKLKEVKALRELYFETGPAPREVNDEIWEEFKKVTRAFNKKKNSYYKELKKEQQDNLDKKMKLIEIAEEHRDSENWHESVDTMKRIQREWKEIGHVPRKVSDKIWKRFQTACNAFFDRRTQQKKKENKKELENYEKKMAIYDELKELVPKDDKSEMKSSIKKQMDAWNEIGHVPHSKRFINDKFNKLLKAKLKAAGMEEKEAELMKYQTKLASLEEGSERDMRNERFYLKKKRSELEDEKLQLENNLQFINAKDDKNPFLVSTKKKIADIDKQIKTIKAKQKEINILERKMKKEEQAKEEE